MDLGHVDICLALGMAIHEDIARHQFSDFPGDGCSHEAANPQAGKAK